MERICICHGANPVPGCPHPAARDLGIPGAIFDKHAPDHGPAGFVLPAGHCIVHFRPGQTGQGYDGGSGQRVGKRLDMYYNLLCQKDTIWKVWKWFFKGEKI